jgi:hypothetical protein
MNTEDLKSAPVNQWASSIFWLIPLALLFGVLLVVASFALINWALPDEDAKFLKNLFGLTIGGSTGGAALSGAIGFVQRSLRLTEAKVQNQLTEAVSSSVTESVAGLVPEEYRSLANELLFHDTVPRGAVKDSE